ncbi:MAG: glycosyl hydrolase [Patescibacteria group bacterium]
MKRLIPFLLFLCLLCFLSSKDVLAIVDPLFFPNNKFGIHIIDENDLNDAASLVNSNGGQWGYVTLVLAEKDRDKERVQNIFDRMRDLKLIPIIRLATKPEGEIWQKPKEEDAIIWAQFLDSLNWVIQNRYVILFNEPNHAKEWGGNVSPQEYAQIAKTFSEKLKDVSDDFFVLPAGFDTSCPNSSQTMEFSRFLNQMIEEDPQIFLNFDGWTSHSYPNPGFSGSIFSSGQGSIKSYEFEIGYIKKFSAKENLPIFITETGWIHNGNNQNLKTNSPEEAANLFKKAYEDVWTDQNIIAITPFLLNYQDSLFEEFSWKKKNSNDFYPQFEAVQSLLKETGSPKQIDSLALSSLNFPEKTKTGLLYPITLTITNTGQTVWEKGTKLSLGIKLQKSAEIEKILSKEVLPFEKIAFNFFLKTSSNTINSRLVFSVRKNGQVLGESVQKDLKTTYLPKFFTKLFNSFRKKDSTIDTIDLDSLSNPYLNSNLFFKKIFARL